MSATSQTIDAPVRAVTVFEDRAQVQRGAMVRLPRGRHQLQIAEVTPLVVDRTLRATRINPVFAQPFGLVTCPLQTLSQPGAVRTDMTAPITTRTVLGVRLRGLRQRGGPFQRR